MWLLHSWLHHDNQRITCDESVADGERSARRVVRQFVPVHWLRRHRGVHNGRCAGDGGGNQASADMIFEKSAVVKAPVDRIWAMLLDPNVMGACVPGVETIEVVSNSEYLVT